MIKFTTSIRVRYADTDQMQFVYNGKYLEYFEVGRTELLRHFGLSYKTIEDNGYQLPLIEASIKYLAPCTYDDLIDIETTVEKLRTAKLHIIYKIFKKDNEEILVEGFTDHLFIKTETKKAVRPPDFYIDALSKYFD